MSSDGGSADVSPECIDVLTLASVLGREFGLDALERLSERPARELLDVLDHAVAARVVTDVPGTTRRLRFAHALIRDTLYDSLTTARRVALHRRAAEALEELYARNPEPHLHRARPSLHGRGARRRRVEGGRPCPARRRLRGVGCWHTRRRLGSTSSRFPHWRSTRPPRTRSNAGSISPWATRSQEQATSPAPRTHSSGQ